LNDFFLTQKQNKMKTITKIIATSVAAVALFFTTTDANAQNQKLGIGLNIGAGTGGPDFAIGGDLRYQIDVDKQLSIPITAGYTNLSSSTDIGNVTIKSNFGYIPVKAGVKYFFDPSGAGLYGLAELGAGFGTTSGSGTSFVYSPAIGYAWSNGLDIGAKYEGLSQNGGSVGYVGLRIAYGFSL
jgi:hypothetical protein